MELKPGFAFAPLPSIERPLRFSSVHTADSPLGLLGGLKGTWTGTGFNVIWRPFQGGPPNQDRFLELNLTEETLRFEEIPGAIPNRGLLQPDIKMFGLWYLQTIADANIRENGKPAGLHLEPGIWATVPRTEHPQEAPTVVRMASIPHGTTVIAQGLASTSPEKPDIADINITPFVIGNPVKLVTFPESNLSIPSEFRTTREGLDRIDQHMVDNPNVVLERALQNSTAIKNTVVLTVSSDASTPVFGGGVANTAFLQGSPSEGPNAQAALVTATFWIETTEGPVAGGPDFHQLQYTQRVLLNFNGLSWPHITVATLLKSSPYTVMPGDTLTAIAFQFYNDGAEPLWRKIYNANIAEIGPDPDVLAPGQQLNIPT
jgi:LysM repeat protein